MKSILFIGFLLLALTSSFFVFPGEASALSLGGRILATFPCTSGGFLVVVGPPKPGFFLFQGGISQLHRYYRPIPPAWSLGNYKTGGVCVVGLITVPVQGTIQSLGTSLF